MKMLLPRFLSTVICTVFIATGAVSGEGVLKAVGDQVSFRPDKFNPSVTSIIWKHRNSSGITVKAIEWDEGEPEILIPNSRFQGITTVDEKTGEITIKNLNFKHSGVYTIDINSKEQEQRFTLTVKEPVPQPEIKIEKSDNANVVYLRCEYNEPIIWKNSTGNILQGSKISLGESITVKKNGDPNNFYTCTLDNGASKKTSDPVYERDLFKDGPKSGSWWIVIIVILIIIVFIIAGVIFRYIRDKNFKKRVDDCFPCLSGDPEGQPKNPAPAPAPAPESNDKGGKGSEAVNMIQKPENERKNDNNDETNNPASKEDQSLVDKL